LKPDFGNKGAAVPSFSAARRTQMSKTDEKVKSAIPKSCVKLLAICKASKYTKQRNFKLKKIINAIVYNTNTAKKIASVHHKTNNHSNWFQEELYTTENGRWFIAGEGGSHSHYAIDEGEGNMNGGSDLLPRTIPETMSWLEKHRKYDVLEEYFAAYLQTA
jgi:hypothetical protein